MNAKKRKSESGKKASDHPFRAAVFRGLGVVLPPLLTIVIFLWIGGTIQQYVLGPVTTGTRNALVWAIKDIQEPTAFPVAERSNPNPVLDGVEYQQLADDSYVPKADYQYVAQKVGKSSVPRTGEAFYYRYVELTYLQPYLAIPFFLSVFILLLYLFGKFMAAGIGRLFWNLFERGVHQVPLVRNVYSSVKQVSDFLLSERELEYSRVVAVEYPCKGIWSLGLVTGESMQDIEAAANEPVLSVLVPTSPAPVTGFTVTVRKSEALDLDITVEQAFQFIISCGVVVPPQQLREFRAPLKAPPPLVEADDSADAAGGDRHAVEQEAAGSDGEQVKARRRETEKRAAGL